MPVTQQFTLQQKLQTYREVISRTVIAELSHEVKVKGGYAAAKKDAIDEALSLAKFCSFGALEALNVPGGSIVTGAIEFVADYANDKRKEAGNQHAAEQFLAITKERLRIILEMVTLEIARWHEWFINVRLPDDSLESVEAIGEIAAKRMVNYIKENRLPLTKENLLIGIIKGRSGRGAENLIKNNSLIVKNPAPKTRYTIEGLLGRPLIKYGNDYYGLLDKKQVALRRANPISNLPTNNNNATSTNTILGFLTDVKDKLTPSPSYGYTKTTAWKDPNQPDIEKFQPKYGIVIASKKIIDELQYQVITTSLTFSSELQQEIDNNPSTLQAVNRQDVVNYANHLASVNLDNNNQVIPSFIDFMKQKNPALTTVVFVADDPNEYDLSQVNLNNANFNECVLNGCKFGNISNAKFDNASLIEADLTQVNASGASFYGTHMQCVKAAGVKLRGASLIGTLLQFSDLSNADLHQTRILGVNWVGATLKDIQVDNQELTEAIKNQQTHQEDQLTKQQQEIISLKTEQASHKEDLREQRDAIVTIASKMEEKDEHIQKAKESIETLRKQMESNENENDNAKKEQTEKVTELLNVIAQLQQQIVTINLKQTNLENQQDAIEKKFIADQELLALKQILNFDPLAIQLAELHMQKHKINVTEYLQLCANFLLENSEISQQDPTDSKLMTISLYFLNMGHEEALALFLIIDALPKGVLEIYELIYTIELEKVKKILALLVDYLLVEPFKSLKEITFSQLGEKVAKFLFLASNQSPEKLELSKRIAMAKLSSEIFNQAVHCNKISETFQLTNKFNISPDFPYFTNVFSGGVLNYGFPIHNYIVHSIIENHGEAALEFLKHPLLRFDRRDSDGNTPLHLAVAKRSLPMAEQILLSIEANSKNITQNFNKSNQPFAKALPTLGKNVQDNSINLNNNESSNEDENESTKEYEFYKSYFQQDTLPSEPMVNMKNDDGKTPLHLAFNNGHMEMIALLLQCDLVDPDIVINSDGNTLFYWAYENNPPIFELILGNRLRHAKLANDFGPLISNVMQTGNMLIIDRLIERGLNIKDKDQQGFTVLHHALGVKLANMDFKVKFIQYLITRGADPNQQNNAGDTPLHIAVREDELPLVNAAFTWESFGKTNALDHTPMHDAILKYNLRIVELLTQHYQHRDVFIKFGDEIITMAVKRYQGGGEGRWDYFDFILGAWQACFEHYHNFDPNIHEKTLEFIYKPQLTTGNGNLTTPGIIKFAKMHFAWLELRFEDRDNTGRHYFDPRTYRDSALITILKDHIPLEFKKLLTLQVTYLEEDDYLPSLNPMHDMYSQNRTDRYSNGQLKKQNKSLLHWIREVFPSNGPLQIRAIKLQLKFIDKYFKHRGSKKVDYRNFYVLFFSRDFENTLLDYIFNHIDDEIFTSLIAEVIDRLKEADVYPKQIILDKLNDLKQTYVDMALAKGKISAAILLVEAGVTFRVFDDQGQCVVDQVKNKKELLQLIIAMQSLPESWWQQTDNSRILFWGVRQEDPEVMQGLLAAGTNPNVADKDGRTPLYVLAEILDKKFLINAKLEKVLDLLIDYGANANSLTDQLKKIVSSSMKKRGKTFLPPKERGGNSNDSSKEVENSLKKIREKLTSNIESSSNRDSNSEGKLNDEYLKKASNILEILNQHQFYEQFKVQATRQAALEFLIESSQANAEETKKFMQENNIYQYGREQFYISHNKFFLVLLNILEFNSVAIEEVCVYLHVQNISVAIYLLRFTEVIFELVSMGVPLEISAQVFPGFLLNLEAVKKKFGDTGIFLITLMWMASESSLLGELLNYVDSCLTEAMDKDERPRQELSWFKLSSLLDMLVDYSIVQPYESLSSVSFTERARKMMDIMHLIPIMPRLKKYCIKMIFGMAKNKLAPFVFDLVLRCNLNPDMTTQLRWEKTPEGQYLIHEVIEKYDAQVVLNFLKAPLLRVDRQNLTGETPLHLAIKRDNSLVVNGVLAAIETQIKNQKNEDLTIDFIVNSKDDCGKTPLHLAFDQKSTYLMLLLLECPYVNPDIIVGHGNMSLLKWAFENEQQLVQLIIINRLSNAKLKNDFKPLMTCIMRAGNLGVIDLMVKFGINFGDKDNYGHTVLQCAKEVDLENTRFKQAFIDELKRKCNPTSSSAQLTVQAQSQWMNNNNNNNEEPSPTELQKIVLGAL